MCLPPHASTPHCCAACLHSQPCPLPGCPSAQTPIPCTNQPMSAVHEAPLPKPMLPPISLLISAAMHAPAPLCAPAARCSAPASRCAAPAARSSASRTGGDAPAHTRQQGPARGRELLSRVPALLCECEHGGRGAALSQDRHRQGQAGGGRVCVRLLCAGARRRAACVRTRACML